MRGLKKKLGEIVGESLLKAGKKALIFCFCNLKKQNKRKKREREREREREQ